jgi:uncharacterized protein (TIGR03089 family)
VPSIPTGPAGLLATTLADDPTRPFLTYYDELTGERTELSATTLDNWVAKTANLLADGSGLDADGTAAVLLPAHWQTAAVLLGAWSVGLSATISQHPGAGAASPEGAGAPVDVAFVAVDRVAEAAGFRPGETFVLALAPMAAPVRELPDGTADYVLSARAHGDHFRPAMPVDPDAPALADPAGAVTHGTLVSRATERAVELGLARGDRLLVTTGGDRPETGGAGREPAVLDWLLAPLAAGASVVLCRHAGGDRVAAIAAAERTTATLGGPASVAGG